MEAHNLLAAGLTSVGIANASPGGRQRLIFLGNILPMNPTACLTDITGANYERHPLDVVFVQDPHFPSGQEWWQSLAAANGGSFQAVQ